MGFKLNPLTGKLDLVNNLISGTTSVLVPAGQTVTVDSVTHSTLKTIDYLVNIHKSDFTKTRAFKMILSRDGSDVKDSVYSRVGNDLNCAVVSNVVGLDAIISVTNNEAFDITCSFNKIGLN